MATSIFDMRCTARQPGVRTAGDSRRCQLLAGHEGKHAVMFVRARRRTLRSWRGGDPTTIRDQPLTQPNLPWVIGMPVPAWRESA